MLTHNQYFMYNETILRGIYIAYCEHTSVRPSVCLSIYLFIYLFIFVYLYIFTFVKKNFSDILH